MFVAGWHFTNPKGGTKEGLILALNRVTGAELWKLVLAEPSGIGEIARRPVLAGDLLLGMTIAGSLYAVRRSTGEVAWKYRSPAYLYGTLAAPAVVGNIIYATMGDEQLTALRVDNGSVLWSVPPLGATKDLLATDRRVYVPRDGRLNIHDRETGALIATGRVKTEGGAFTTAATALGDQIFITSSEGAWSFREPK
ncbi:MAG TPA: PQQ-binding-like beta-propeller repeat protein [Gemmatimonadaceae bacterium]|nr:PQQ-binding-like beta-propeller repeat protein [Gemmatimonadaceae bacterium]